MSGKAERLGRLASIRRMLEEADRRALAIASSALAQVESALGAQGSALIEAGHAAREALAAGDRREWLLADAQSEVAGWNRARLKLLELQRRAELVPAREDFRRSRMEHEQVKHLFDETRRREREEEDRRAQAEADERFLSRRDRARRGR